MGEDKVLSWVSLGANVTSKSVKIIIGWRRRGFDARDWFGFCESRVVILCN